MWSLLISFANAAKKVWFIFKLCAIIRATAVWYFVGQTNGQVGDGEKDLNSYSNRENGVFHINLHVYYQTEKQMIAI